MMQLLAYQIVALLVLAVPIACVAWTCTHEELFREPREFCQRHCKGSRSFFARKFFYIFTCEYCFSHYVTAAFLIITRYKLLYDDWRGYLVAFFALVWIANQYISVYNRLRLVIKEENIEIEEKQEKVQNKSASGGGKNHPER